MASPRRKLKSPVQDEYDPINEVKMPTWKESFDNAEMVTKVDKALEEEEKILLSWGG